MKRQLTQVIYGILLLAAILGTIGVTASDSRYERRQVKRYEQPGRSEAASFIEPLPSNVYMHFY